MSAAPPHAVIVGASVAGLGAALALGRIGFRVTCLERDATPLPADHLEAARTWQRRGAAQTRHSHVFLAPLVNLIEAHAPELRKRLFDAGAEELGFADMASATFGDVTLEPGDEKIRFLACRRVVFEYVLRRFVGERLGVTIIDGATVTGFLGSAGAPPRIHGVRFQRLDDSVGELEADIVVDASGRHGDADAWLAAIGVTRPETESEPCGIFYTSRFYRLRDGADYPVVDGRRSIPGGVQGVDLGYLKVGVFRADNRTFSITLAADPEDSGMRVISREREFDVAVANIDATRPWVDPARAEPISKVYLYGNLANTRRRFVREGEPLVLGYFAVGDSHVHTNPLTGRGCALGWVSAFALADVLATKSDARDRALAFEAKIDEAALPWYRLQVRQDRQAIEINKALQRNEDPYAWIRSDGSIDEGRRQLAIARKGFTVAAREHIDVLRALLRQGNLLDPPEALLARHDLLGKVFASYEKAKDEDIAPRPTRDEMLARFASAA